MTFSVNQHWDPLKVCLVGSTFPPEFYSFITNPRARSVMERIAQETVDDLNTLEKKLQAFGVKTIRTTINENADYYLVGQDLLSPPTTPRDDVAMIGDTFYMPTTNRSSHWNYLRGSSWPIDAPSSIEEWNSLPMWIKDELEMYNVRSLAQLYYRDFTSLADLEKLVMDQGNKIVYDTKINSAMISRIGKDLYTGTWGHENTVDLQKEMQSLFPEYRCHVIETNGHLDGTFYPVKEGLILATRYIQPEVFAKHFPGWEIYYLDNNNIKSVEFSQLKKKNQGKWWVPGEELNDEFTEFVQTYIEHWLGLIDETVIGVNLMSIDESNLLTTGLDENLYKVLDRHGVTPHVINLRHYNFWDGGIHCVTADIDRQGFLKDYFPGRSNAS